MTIQEIEAQFNTGKISADDQVWWTMETGDMVVVSNESELGDNWDWSLAGTVAEMIAAQE